MVALAMLCLLLGASMLLTCQDATHSSATLLGQPREILFQEVLTRARRIVNKSAWWRDLRSDALQMGEFELSPTNHELKFAKMDLNVRRAFDDAELTGLLSSNRQLRVLDVGSGPGWFVWLARELGHQAEGLEPLSSKTSEVKAWMSRLLGVTPIDEAVQAMQTLPAACSHGGRFDVVTSWGTLFDLDSEALQLTEEWQAGKLLHLLLKVPELADKWTWGFSKWAFWITDVACNLLKPHGWIILEMQLYDSFGRAARQFLEAAGVRVQKHFLVYMLSQLHQLLRNCSELVRLQSKPV